MPPLSERTAAIQTRLDAATPGPWFPAAETILRTSDVASEWVAEADSVMDAEFIAHAPADIRFLLTALVSAEARITKALEVLGTENAWDGHARADQLDAARAALTGGTPLFDPQQLREKIAREERQAEWRRSALYGPGGAAIDPRSVYPPYPYLNTDRTGTDND